MIKIPRGSISLKAIRDELKMIESYNKKLTHPILLPKTDIAVSKDYPEQFVLIQEYIPGNVLTFESLKESKELQEKFQYLLENSFHLLQKHSEEEKKGFHFQKIWEFLHTSVVGKKRTTQELLRNFIVDEYNRIRVVSLFILEMDIESVNLKIRNRVEKVLGPDNMMQMVSESSIESV